MRVVHLMCKSCRQVFDELCGDCKYTNECSHQLFKEIVSEGRPAIGCDKYVKKLSVWEQC